MKVIEITEDGKDYICKLVCETKEKLEELEHELKSSYMDTRRGYPSSYDRDYERDRRDRGSDRDYERRRDRYGY